MPDICETKVNRTIHTTAPQPVPAKTDYLIGAYYYPGWNSPGAWYPIQMAGFPIPLLGFYREGMAEVADWHIKWAVEHGINHFVYD